MRGWPVGKRRLQTRCYPRNSSSDSDKSVPKPAKSHVAPTRRRTSASIAYLSFRRKSIRARCSKKAARSAYQQSRLRSWAGRFSGDSGCIRRAHDGQAVSKRSGGRGTSDMLIVFALVGCKEAGAEKRCEDRGVERYKIGRAAARGRGCRQRWTPGTLTGHRKTRESHGGTSAKHKTPRADGASPFQATCNARPLWIHRRRYPESSDGIALSKRVQCEHDQHVFPSPSLLEKNSSYSFRINTMMNWTKMKEISGSPDWSCPKTDIPSAVYLR
ncbi:hypothetical protein CCHR01_07749 [Colletotrichum chrysophilum]|uniref:Uncharacterized protein n=1 Tax=Colletotrichum chrysophilum TaxID=1836956 RepID=A0AAD9EIH4_9PEZI|nr:hypothetical protein CCHR01_07749 [Colletotrichum chrysophilum]